MSRLLSLLIVLLFIAPALLARGAEMRQSVRRGRLSARWGRWGRWRGGCGLSGVLGHRRYRACLSELTIA